MKTIERVSIIFKLSCESRKLEKIMSLKSTYKTHEDFENKLKEIMENIFLLRKRLNIIKN